MKNTLPAIIFFLLLQSCSVSTSENQTAHITIGDTVINESFGGVGFHVFYHIHQAPKWHYEQVFAKRWRELNPSFARITDYPHWDKEKINEVSQYLEVMKDTDTELYFTTWGTDAINNYTDANEYVIKQVANLDYWKQVKGFSNLNYYCMTNELSIEEWASIIKRNELERFKEIHTLFYDLLSQKGIEIKLLASDASPISNWNTIEWAANNMDDITGVYGGHHYINDYDLFDNSFYPFFLEKMKWGSTLAKEKNKKFIIGEFGPKQNSNTIDSVRHDACIYNNTPLEKFTGIQIGEAILAMINGGIYSGNYWTFSDFPSTYRSTYINKWGVFKWEIDDFSPRPSYFALGLLTKYFRGPAKVFEVSSTDSLIRVAAIQNLEDNSYSIAVINRTGIEKQLQIQMDWLDRIIELRKYVYDPEHVPFNYFGDLQSYSEKVALKNGEFSDEVPPLSLVVYTSKFDEIPPEKVKNLKIELEQRDRMRHVLTWDPNTEADFCYYRIYRSENEQVKTIPEKEIATTITAEYVDLRDHGLPPYYYKVVAVDNSGNSSE